MVALYGLAGFLLLTAAFGAGYHRAERKAEIVPDAEAAQGQAMQS